MATVSINAPGLSGGLLYNNGSNNARVCITSETGEFDMQTIKNWQDEGFDVVYLPLDGGGKDYEGRLKGVREGLGVGENYAVIGKVFEIKDAKGRSLANFYQLSARRRTIAWTIISNRKMQVAYAHLSRTIPA